MRTTIKYSWKSEAIPTILIGISILVTRFLYDSLPEQIATHWDLYGHVNGYSPRSITLFLFPILMTFVYGVFLVLPYIDPKGDNYRKFESTYHQFKAIFVAMLLVIYLAILLFNTGYTIPVAEIISLDIAGLFIFLGISLKKIRRNWFFGIRTPWTLSSDTIWDQTHSFGGKLFFILGLILIITLPFGSAVSFLFFIPGILLTVISTIIYSYRLYKK